MADSPASQLLDVAVAIAGYAPKRQNKYTHCANVSWKLIHELRDALDAVGVEWRKS